MVFKSSGDDMPPPGYLADQDRGTSFVVYTIIIVSLGVVSVVVRFCSRAVSSDTATKGFRFWWDDWAALGALIFMVAAQTIAGVMVHFGFGRHAWNVSPKDFSTVLKLLVADEALFVPGAALAKTSALFFYARVFQTEFCPKWFKFGLYITHALNACWFIAADVSLLLMCDPPSKQWKPEEPGHCGEIGTYWMGNIIPGLFIDFLVLLLPMPLIWGISLSLERKIGLLIVFFFGYSVIVITVGRLVTILVLQQSIDDDFTWNGIIAYYWYGAEVPTTLLSSTLLVMTPLLRRMFSKFRPLSRRMRNSLRIRSNSNKEFDGQSLGKETLGGQEPNRGIRSRFGFFLTHSSAHTLPEWITGFAHRNSVNRAASNASSQENSDRILVQTTMHISTRSR